MKTKQKIITPDLLAFLRMEFRLPWNGTHGVSHWARVRFNGLRLAALNNANSTVVELFAFMHDLRRRNDHFDPLHGPRAASLAEELNGRYFTISMEEQELLSIACHGHTRERTHDDVTVRTCWDADRLDLGRVGIRPRAKYLCTPEARNNDVIEEAYTRSRRYR